MDLKLAFDFKILFFCFLISVLGCNPRPQSTAPVAQPKSFELSVDSKTRLLKEIYDVVFQTADIPSDIYPKQFQGQFQSHVQAVQQGASLMGLYNGLVHSAMYRIIETKTPPASNRTLALFSEEVSYLISEGEVLEASAARTLPTMMGYDELEGVTQKSRVADIALKDAAAVEKKFTKLSVYTLKRVWSDLLLSRLYKLENSATSRAEWFADFAVRTSKRGVSFGLKARDSTEKEFFKKWAESAPQDLIYWEVLNRAHRLLNAR